MRIGILTLPLHTNYGGIVQAYALQTVLQRMGHDVSVINRPTPKKPAAIRVLIYYLRRLFRHYILGNKAVSTRWNEGAIKEYKTTKSIYDFINYKIHNRFITDLTSLKPTEFDAIVVGSDQIWRKAYFTDIEDAFLKFAEEWDVLRVAYSASFGKDNIDDYTAEEKANIRRLLSKFDKVSVRESSGITICREEFSVDAEQMLDPTMLLSADDYNKIIEDYGAVKFSGNFYNYILDEREEISETIKAIEQQNGWTSYRVNDIVSTGKHSSTRIQPQSVERWLQAIRDAEAIITDSFHGCVFSIIFNKPFIVFGNQGRGMSRFESLLKMTGLTDRLVSSKAEAISKLSLLTHKPNVLGLIEEKKKTALEYLSILKKR